MKQRTLQEYVEHVRTWQWDEIKQEALRHVKVEDATVYAETWLGTIFALTPTGKIYTPWANGNVTREEAEQDTLWFEALDQVANEQEGFIDSCRDGSEGIFFVQDLGYQRASHLAMFDKIAGELDGKERKKVRYATWAIAIANDEVGIRHHQTVVLRYRDDGSIFLDCNGWRSSTTKERLNNWLPPQYEVHQKDYVWYINNCDDTQYEYQDMMQIMPNGTMIFGHEREQDRQAKVKGVKKHARAIAKAVVNGKVTNYNTSCCKVCGEHGTVRNPTPSRGFAKHLWAHIIRGNGKLQITHNAMKSFPLSIVAQEFVSRELHEEPVTQPLDAKWLAQDQLTSSIRRYLFREMSIPA